MADAHKFTTLSAATDAFPDLPWKASDTKVWVFDEKTSGYVEVTKGQFIYKVGDRYEVRDAEELPKTVKPATEKDEVAVEKAVEAKTETKSDKDK